MIKAYILGKALNLYSGFKDSESFPLNINIELTNNCNLSCAMCPRKQMKRPVSYLSKEVLHKIVKEMCAYKKRIIWLHLFGEPLLYPELGWAVRLLRKNCPDSKIYLSTNCQLLDEKLSLEILNSGLDMIRLCIDTVDPQVYRSLRSGGDFNKVVDNIKSFLSEKYGRSLYSPRVEIQYLVRINQKQQRDSFVRYWKSYLYGDDKIHFQRFTNFANNIPESFAGARTDNFSLYVRKFFGCRRLWRDIAIYCNGDISACCYDSDGRLIIGNVNSNTIREIWNGPDMKNIREAHLDGDLSKFKLCLNCLGDSRI
ncbi:MAG: radical SAM protein [Candidatus Omnitrophica bacterium]|nr:radical SAM protein [Candidatus Omnitrophota bacterium]MBU1869063.1 radical SAM protein [Candidatus Omnitrophota bacterium]